MLEKSSLLSRMIHDQTVLLCLVYLSCAFPYNVFAGDCQSPVAEIVSVQGVVESRTPGAKTWNTVIQSDKFCPGDQLRVRANSRAGLYLSNETFLRLSEQTSIRFSGQAEESSTWLELMNGIAHFMSRVKHSFEIRTAYVNAAIDGTEFTVSVDEASAQVTVMEGAVIARNDLGSIRLIDGQSALAVNGKAPVLQLSVQPRDAVQWTLYYPPVLHFDSAEMQEALGQSIDAYRRGDLVKAFSTLSDLGKKQQVARFYTYRATLNLSIGRIENARADIDQALKLQAENADALALKSIIATVQNNADEALALAQQAITANQNTAGPQIALSYALQARFDLDQARKAAMKATELEPGNALAWSRLAEMQLMHRNLDAATQASQRAVELDPDIALTQATRGFANLIRLDIKSAKERFEQSMALDQAAPLPRLGLGLAMIRDGALSDGRRMIETAANLDPGNALIRSYLGKAYYEEKRGEEAATQFELAKTLDPIDPTAWFYDAILKQSENRPIEALDDLQTSITLNDNRAVYRSRLLLDQDEATRSANLARIYENLGFRRLALSESWKSLSIDPGNSSAHRLLSDAYANVPRHEIAHKSELLQAQLLQPAAVTPVRPSAGETSVQAVDGTGPSSTGFNEFNPLFNRKRYNLLASGIYGSNDTRGSEIAAAAFFNRGMISAGRFQHRSDGVRENNDSDQTIQNLFAQVRVTPALSIQGEYKDSESSFGDLTLRIDEKVDSIRRNIESESWRVGLNYTPSPHHTYLVSAVRQDLNDNVNQGSDLLSINLDLEKTTSALETKYIYYGDQVRTQLGLSYLESDETETEIETLTFFGMTEETQTVTENAIEQLMAYFYTHIPWWHSEWTVGLEYAEIDEQNGLAKDQLNPKFGLVSDITPQTRLRLAAFRTLRIELANNQTIAPTQTAGCNQLFDTTLGSNAWHYCIGLDQEISDTISAGVELNLRDIEEIITGSPDTEEEEQQERTHKAYLYWTPWSNLALSGEYHYNIFERSTDTNIVADRPIEITTHSLPLRARYFHPSGFFASWQTSYVKQQVEKIVVPGEIEKLEDSFWITDASLGYRLPRRQGLFELTLRNLFDERFRYRSTDPGTGNPLPSPYYPDRAVFLQAHLAF